MRFITLILLVFLSSSFHAQPWLENLPKNKLRQELSFFDYQQAFQAYWQPYNVVDGYYMENGERKKAAGWKQFKRWEYMMELRVDKYTGAFPDKSTMEIVNEHTRLHPPMRTLPVSNWKSLGPTYSNGGYEGIGRVNCVAFHPTDVSTTWAGAASGGLWVT